MPSRYPQLVVAAALGVLLAGLPLQATAGSDPQPSLDRGAVYKTHVPHRNSLVAAGRDSGPAGTQPATPATFNSGPAYTVGPTITPTTTFPEAEEHIAVNPSSSSNLVAAISDFSLRGGSNTTKFAVSTANGGTWTEHFVPRDANGFPVTSDGQGWEANSDPVVAIDKPGNVYLADLYFNASNNANGFYVSVGTSSALNGGGNFANTNPVAKNLSTTTNLFEDKPWIAADNGTACIILPIGTCSNFTANVYVSWTHFVGNSGAIFFARSTDHGATWTTTTSSSAPINLTSQNGAVQGSQVAVGPDGSVYVAYQVFFRRGLRQHFLAKSTDGGVNFSPPVAITPFFNELTFRSSYRKNSFPALAVNPTNGAIYDVYADQPSRSLGAQVEFISKASTATSFTSPVSINDFVTGQQFMPAVTVDSAGTIHASWFDTRNSSTGSSSYDIFATRSTDGGATFAPNARVTSTLVSADNVSFIGDYAGIAAAGGSAHPVWTSGGFNNGLLETAILS